MPKNNRVILLVTVALVVACIVACIVTTALVARRFLNRDQSNEALVEAVRDTTADRPYVSDIEYTIDGVSGGRPSPSYVDYGVDEVWCFYLVPINDEKTSGIAYRSGERWHVELVSEEEWGKNSCPNEYQENMTLLGLWFLSPGHQ